MFLKKAKTAILLSLTCLGLQSFLLSNKAEAFTFNFSRSLDSYGLNLPGATAQGSIETDGSLGYLSASNITNWNIDLKHFDSNGAVTAFRTLTSANSSVGFLTYSSSLTGGDILLRATTTDLILEESTPNSNSFKGLVFYDASNSSYSFVGNDNVTGNAFYNKCPLAQQGTEGCLGESISIAGSGWINYVPTNQSFATAATPVPFDFSPNTGLMVLGIGYAANRWRKKRKAAKQLQDN